MMKPSTQSLQCATCTARTAGFLCSLEDQELLDCTEHKTSNTYKKGQILFYEDNQPLGVYCIFAGRVKLYKSGANGDQMILRLAGSGELVGYRALFSEEVYHATAEALEDTIICCIEKQTFFDIMRQNRQLSHQIIQKLGRDLRKAEDLAAGMIQKTVSERMAELLLLLKETYGKRTEMGVRIDLQLSREEMAEMIGATQETAIRLLSHFKKTGLIGVNRRDITILDTEKLIEVAGIQY